jgi:hypothetical protein
VGKVSFPNAPYSHDMKDVAKKGHALGGAPNVINNIVLLYITKKPKLYLETKILERFYKVIFLVLKLFKCDFGRKALYSKGNGKIG